MPNSRKVSDFVDIPKAKEEFGKLTNMAKEYRDFLLTIPEIYGKAKTGNSAISDLLKEIESLKKVQKDLIDSTDKANKANEAYQKTIHDIALDKAKQKIQDAEKNKALKEEAKEALGLNDAYAKLNKQYIEAAKNAKKIGAEQGISSKAFQESAKHAKILSDQLKGIDNAVGQNQRNVGNYAEGVREGLSKISPEADAAVGKIGQIGGALAKMGPYGAAAAGAILALSSPLVAFYKTTQEGMDRLTITTAGFHAAIGTLMGKLSGIGKIMDDAMGGDKPEKASHFWATTLTAIGAGSVVAAGLVPKLKAIGDEMDRASDKAKSIACDRISLEKEEITLIMQRSEANNKLANARLKASDENNTLAQKRDLYKAAFVEEDKVAKLEIESAIKKAKIQENNIALLKLQNKLTREDLTQLQQDYAAIIDLDSESTRRKTKGARQ